VTDEVLMKSHMYWEHRRYEVCGRKAMGLSQKQANRSVVART